MTDHTPQGRGGDSFTKAQCKQILLSTLPELARKVERQKRKRMAAAGLAAVGGIGLGFPHAFRSELLNKFVRNATWREDLDGRIATYNLTPGALLNAWPDESPGRGDIETAGAGPSEDLSSSDARLELQIIKSSLESHRRKTIARLLSYCDMPRNNDQLSKFLTIYGKCPNGLEATRNGGYRFRDETFRQAFRACLQKAFSSQYHNDVEGLLQEALEAHGFRGLEYQLETYRNSGISRKDIHAIAYPIKSGGSDGKV